jgi:dTDP-4-amino-4,6-dideoxygalactose transaminase
MIGKMNVPLYRHNLITENCDELGKTFGNMLKDMIISTGSVNKTVSDQFAKYLNTKYCLLTSSWTGGMLATLLAIGVKPDDEIIIPASTFAATANVIEVLGAKPVFVDIDADTKLLDIDLVSKKITSKTKAIIPVHLYGQMVDVKKLRDCVPLHIHIIEDSAHAIEASYLGNKPGSFSDAAVFSFYQSKNMTTGEGGAIVTNNKDLHDKIKLTYRHGIDLCGYQRHIREEFIAPDAILAGIKANLPDILAILLPPQIEKAEENIARRSEIAQRYIKELGELVTLPHFDPNCKHAWHIFAVGVDPTKREQILVNLYNNGIKTTVHFRALHTTKYYKEKYNFKNEDFPNAYLWGEQVFSLPIFPGLTNEEQDYVIQQVKLSLA